MIFTFNFDDSYRSFLEASRILSKHGFRGTFNICLRGVVCERFTDRERMFPQKDVLTWDEVKSIQDAGHEIASHGIRHPDIHLCTDEELRFELEQSKKLFTGRGVNVTSYACPFNDFTDKAELFSRGVYKSIRGLPGVNPLPFRGRVYHDAVWSILMKDLEKHVKENIWLIGEWHDITPTLFEESVLRVKRLGVPVKTVREMT